MYLLQSYPFRSQASEADLRRVRMRNSNHLERTVKRQMQKLMSKLLMK